MHQTLEIYMARKKRVPGYYNPNSSRIFDDAINDQSLGLTNLNKIYVERKKEPPPPHPREPERRNCPQPYYSRFLTENARTLNEPICIIHDGNGESTKHWWPTSVPDDNFKLPPVTQDSTQRKDYVDHRPLRRKYQHAKNYVCSAKGILPVNPYKTIEDPGEVLLEKISFAHIYNSRAKELMAKRGRRQGCFVWDRVVKDSRGRDVIETAWNRGEIERDRLTALALTSKENQQSKTDLQAVASENTTYQINTTNQPEQAAPSKDQCSIDNNHVAPSKEQTNDDASSIPPIDGLPPP